MSHIHLPDGILPVWVWILGFALIGVMVTLSSALIARKPDARKRVPLAAVTAALVIVAMSVPLAPIPVIPVVYHANLSVLAGAIVGPLLAPIVALIVQFGLWGIGHGGTTTLGLNASVLTLEMIAGWALVQLVTRAFTRKLTLRSVAYFAATVLTLAATTTLMLGVVSTSGDRIELHAHSETEAEHADESPDTELEDEHTDTEVGAQNGEGTDDDHAEDEITLDTFARWIYTVAPLGWALEGFATAVALGFIMKVRPSLLGFTGRVTAAQRDEEALDAVAKPQSKDEPAVEE